MADDGALSVIEQAPVLAPPSNADASHDNDAMVDLDEVDGVPGIERNDGDLDGDDAIAEPETTKPEATELAGEDDEDKDEDGDGTTTLETPAKKPSGSARLKAQVMELQRELDTLRRTAPVADEAAHMASRLEREIGAAPTEADFPGDYIAYSEASSAYKTAAIIVKRDLAKADAAAKEQSLVREQAVAETFRERVAEAKKSITDFDAVVGAAKVSPTHPDTVMLIMESDKSAELAYYLSKHPEVVNAMNTLHPFKQAQQIGKLEAQLSKAKPKIETKAPAPVPALKGGATLKTADPEKMSDTEFDAWYASRKAQRA